MNILVIGNGFDLAHGLPTKYTDFLEFVKVIKQIINIKKTEDLEKIVWDEIHTKVREIIEINMGNTKNNLFSQKSIWEDLIRDNVWVEYFLQCDTFQKENWVDFESEISNVIKSIDVDMRKDGLDNQINDLSNEYLKEQYLYKGFESLFTDDKGTRGGKQEITFRQLRDYLVDDLNKFTRAFEIYLTEYVEKIDVNVISPDIEKAVLRLHEGIKKGVVFSKVLSFNYTKTYQKVYLKEYGVDCDKYIDFIHGKADIDNTIESNNMVLGIDEYLSKKKRNKKIEFIAFKKYYQRIHKATGCKYKEWIDKIKNEDKKKYRKKRSLLKSRIDQCEDKIERATERGRLIHELKELQHNLYIFGHSLDITDKDILRDLILNDNVYTTIFYPDKEELGRKIANLVKVIGQDELIRRTGGSTKTIEFKLQKPMVGIEAQDC